MKIPASIIQGDTVTWRDEPGTDGLGITISAPDYTLTYHFGGPTTLSAVASAYGDGWETALTSAQTAALSAGTYYWQATAAKAGIVVTLGTGSILVQANLALAAAGYDGRSQAQKDLDAVRAAISARLAGGMVAEYSIGSRRLRNEPMTALLELESRLKIDVARERRASMIANGFGDPRNTFVRFT